MIEVVVLLKIKLYPSVSRYTRLFYKLTMFLLLLVLHVSFFLQKPSSGTVRTFLTRKLYNLQFCNYLFNVYRFPQRLLTFVKQLGHMSQVW
jgi:hypothetical protein